jgi:hypothetical protein
MCLIPSFGFTQLPLSVATDVGDCPGQAVEGYPKSIEFRNSQMLEANSKTTTTTNNNITLYLEQQQHKLST